MRNFLKSIASILLITCLSGSASACTAFFIHQNAGMFLCKNFDWVDGDGLVVFNPSGKQYLDPETGTSWMARYSNITFCYKQSTNTLGGMNEKGLVIEELSSITFPFAMHKDKIQLNEFQWISYHLDNCASVEEVVKNQQYLNLVPEMHCLHYLIADATGDAAIIEFGNGGCVIYRGNELPYPVLSNNPYESSLKYLANFTGFGGNMHIPESKASCDRFVIGVQQLNNIKLDKGVPVEACYCLLDGVRQNDTRWQIVYDLHAREIYFRDKNSSFHHCIYLDAFLDTPGDEGFCISLIGFSGSARLDDMVNIQKPL